MPLIKSSNIACGGHAGDINSMEKCVELSIINNVEIGAHPSYPDKENFGRIHLDIPTLALKESILNQIESLISICKKIIKNNKEKIIKDSLLLGLILIFISSKKPMKNKLKDIKKYSYKIFENNK